MPFGWAEQGDPEKPCEVVLGPETTETVIVLMARVIVAVVRPAEEVDDER